MTNDWVPQACTLPTAEQPLRVAEFGELFAKGLRGMERLAPTRLRLVLSPEVEVSARDLAARETSCCSFFEFAFADRGDGQLLMDVTVPAARAEVLDSLLLARTGQSPLSDS